MPITAQHPSALQLTRTHTVIVDPSLDATSEFSVESLTSLIASRQRFYRWAGVGTIVGVIVGNVVRLAVLPGVAMANDLREVAGWLAVGALTALGMYPAYDRAYKIDQRLREFAKGPHAVTIGRINTMGLDATDATPIDRLWPAVSSYRAVDDSMWALEGVRGVDGRAVAELQARMLREIDELEHHVREAGLTLDTAAFRADATR